MSEPRQFGGFVTRVIDGDTYDVELDLGFRISAQMPLRLAHVDTPELNTEQGVAAKAFITHFLNPLPCPVWVVTYKPRDKYGRYLAEVWVNDQSLAVELLREGLAKPYEGGKK